MAEIKGGPNIGKGTDLDLQKFLKITRKWRKLIIGITLLSILLSGLVSQFVLEPIYQAKTLLMVTVASEKLQTQTTTITRQTTQNSQGATVTNLSTMPVLTMNTYLGQLKSDVVINRVADRIAIPGLNSNNLANMVEATIVPDSNLIEVKVRNQDPVAAKNIANTIADEYLDLMDELMFSSVVVISPANIPSQPVEPNKALNVIMALLLGFSGSLMLAFFLDYLDDTLKTPEDIDRELNLPVLGMIPIKDTQNMRQNAQGGN